MDSDYKVRLATLQAMGGDMTKNYPSVYDVDLAILSYVQQGGGGGGVSQEYVDQQDNAVKEWVASSYVSMTDFEASELVTSKAINDLQSGKEDVGVCVSYAALSAMSYLTTEVDPIFTASPASGISREDLSKWNNTATYLNSYVSKSELSAAAYITAEDVSAMSYITAADVSAMGYITNADVSAMSYATISYVSTYFGRIVTLTQAQYDALAVKDPMTIYIISDAQ